MTVSLPLTVSRVSLTVSRVSGRQEMMDREKSDRLPDMQVEFIDSICLPVYKVSRCEPGMSADNSSAGQTKCVISVLSYFYRPTSVIPGLVDVVQRACGELKAPEVVAAGFGASKAVAMCANRLPLTGNILLGTSFFVLPCPPTCDTLDHSPL